MENLYNHVILARRIFAASRSRLFEISYPILPFLNGQAKKSAYVRTHCAPVLIDFVLKSHPNFERPYNYKTTSVKATFKLSNYVLFLYCRVTFTTTIRLISTTLKPRQQLEITKKPRRLVKILVWLPRFVTSLGFFLRVNDVLWRTRRQVRTDLSLCFVACNIV